MEGQIPAPELIWGAEAIAKAIGRTNRQAFHLLDRGILPAKKVGGRWVAERGKLLAFLTGETTPRATHNSAQ